MDNLYNNIVTQHVPTLTEDTIVDEDKQKYWLIQVALFDKAIMTKNLHLLSKEMQDLYLKYENEITNNNVAISEDTKAFDEFLGSITLEDMKKEFKIIKEI